MVVSIDNPVGKDIVLASKVSVPYVDSDRFGFLGTTDMPPHKFAVDSYFAFGVAVQYGMRALCLLVLLQRPIQNTPAHNVVFSLHLSRRATELEPPELLGGTLADRHRPLRNHIFRGVLFRTMSNLFIGPTPIAGSARIEKAIKTRRR